MYYCYLLFLLFCSIKAGQSLPLCCLCIKQPGLTLNVVLLWAGGWTGWPPGVPICWSFFYFISLNRNFVIWHTDTLMWSPLCPPILMSQQKTISLFLSHASVLSLCRLESRWYRYVAVQVIRIYGNQSQDDQCDLPVSCSWHLYWLHKAGCLSWAKCSVTWLCSTIICASALC